MTSTAQKWIVPANADEATTRHILKPAAEYLAKNEVVAFPTETVYGLGGNALSDEAVKKIFAAKGRPGDNPLIVHIADESMIPLVATTMTQSATKLTKVFWPGPLTVLVPASPNVSSLCTAGQPNVGIRMPNHPVALALIRLSGVPIAAPSANRSGKPSPTTADHVLRDLGNGIVGVVDGGACGVGVESTVVDCTDPDQDTVTILRPGGISREQLRTVIPNVLVDPALESVASTAAPRAPGMKYTHYAPRAPVRIVEGPLDMFAQAVVKLKAQGERVGVLCTEESAGQLSAADSIFVCGRRDDLETVARDLYAALRSFDDTDATVILAEAFPTSEIGHAIMNRLAKSAGHAYIRSLDDV